MTNNIVRSVLRFRRAVRHNIRFKLTGKTYLNDLFEMKEFEKAVSGGHIRRQFHPFEDLAVAYYTETAAFDRVWNDATLTCRGLIYNYLTSEIVARPFGKFFNHNQPEAPAIGWDEPVAVSDKMDGSLGILYQLSTGEWRIATKGSFSSEQSIHASYVFNTKYKDWEPVEGFTYLFEIIYPANRIVCNYGEMDDLVLIGVVEISSGLTFGPDDSEWPGPRTEVFTATDYLDALRMPPRKGKEGIVIRTEDGRMVKVKQADYIALHKIVTGLSARGVWQLMVDGRSLEECIDGVPDEFHGWIREVYSSIADDVDATVFNCESEFEDISRQAREDAEVFLGNPKKAFALLAKTSPNSGYLFRLYDGKDIRSEVLKNARPAADWTPVRIPDEEAA